MNLNNISLFRSLNQQITNSRFNTTKEIASWMGALQAQDYGMSKWTFGIRLPNSTEMTINRAIDSGEIIRTHLLRPTWHFVSSNDIHWILELTAPRIKAALRSRQKQLGLTESIFLKCKKIIEKSLRDNNHKTREELISELIKAKINVDDNRASHIFLQAEIDGIICSGKQKGNKITYAILDEWIPKYEKISREEALKELARRYFTSRGPATIRDVTWWSGLSANDAKLAVELNKSSLISEEIEKQTFWYADPFNNPKLNPDEVHLLPAYDELIISYRDRTPSLPKPNLKKAVSNNGIFYPTIVANGKVIGTWKRTIRKNVVEIETNLFEKGDTTLSKAFLKAATKYSNFIGKKLEMT